MRHNNRTRKVSSVFPVVTSRAPTIRTPIPRLVRSRSRRRKCPPNRHRATGARQSVKHLAERLSRRNRNRGPKPLTSYRNRMVKHQPELHTVGWPSLLYFAGLASKGQRITGR